MTKIECPDVRPHPGQILVKRQEAATMTKGGIVLPQNGRERPYRGKVVAVGGPKALDGGGVREVQCKVGDEVVYTRYAGTDTRINDVLYVCMSDTDVLFVLGPGVDRVDAD